MKDGKLLSSFFGYTIEIILNLQQGSTQLWLFTAYKMNALHEYFIECKAENTFSTHKF